VRVTELRLVAETEPGLAQQPSPVLEGVLAVHGKEAKSAPQILGWLLAETFATPREIPL
jgi:hypothetical protein